MSLFSNDFITTVVPTGISDSLFNVILQSYVLRAYFLRLLKMAAKRINSIEFHFEHNVLTLTNRQRLKAFIHSIFKKEKITVNSVHYVFCSDRQLLKINQGFLKHNYYTDILTFDLADGAAPVVGEVYISLDRVRDNARMLKQYYYVELHRVIFHGVLHLCHYKDKSTQEKMIMRTKENFYLSEYFK
jgi:probable rRNA maturation factor